MYKKYTGKIIQGLAEIPDDFATQLLSGIIGMANLSLSALLARIKAFQLPWSNGLYSIGLSLWRHISKTTVLAL